MLTILYVGQTTEKSHYSDTETKMYTSEGVNSSVLCLGHNPSGLHD